MKKSPKNKKSFMNMKNKNWCDCDCCDHKMHSCGKNHFSRSCGGGIYGLGFIGAAIYYISNSTSFWGGVVGLLKAIVWPAFLVYDLLKFLGM